MYLHGSIAFRGSNGGLWDFLFARFIVGRASLYGYEMDFLYLFVLKFIDFIEKGSQLVVKLY